MKRLSISTWLLIFFVGFLGGSLSQLLFSPSLASLSQTLKKIRPTEPMTARIGDPSVPSPTATDQKSQPPKNPLEVCEKDRARFCPKIALSAPGMAGCLVLKEEELNKECREILSGQIRFRKHCAADIEKFCVNVPSGQGRVAKCLEQHQDSLSEQCRRTLTGPL